MGKLITNAVVITESGGGGGGGGSYNGLGYSLTIRHNAPPPSGFTVTYQGGSLDEDMPWSVNGGEQTGYLTDSAICDDNGNVLQCIENVNTITFGPILYESYGTVFYTMNGASFTVDAENVTDPITLTDDMIITAAESMCLTGDTLVTMADGTYKRIDEIVPGDMLLSFDWKTLRLIPNRVVFTDRAKAKRHSEYDVWVFDDGTVIKTVHRHEFYNVEAQRMKYMDEWKPGEHGRKLDGTEPKLISHRTVRKTVLHYKITGEHGTNYFANGLLTGDRFCPKKIIFMEE